MKKNTRTIKIEVSEFPPIKISVPIMKLNISVKKLEGLLEVEGNCVGNHLAKKIIGSLSNKPMELRISEVEDNENPTSKTGGKSLLEICSIFLQVGGL